MNKIIICFLVILILLIMYSYINFYEKTITGLWSASEDFCDKSEIDGMLIYIGEGLLKKKMYIIIYSDNKVVYDKLLNIKLLPHEILHSIKNITLDKNDLIPCDINMEIDDGKIILKDENTVYAILHKSNVH